MFCVVPRRVELQGKKVLCITAGGAHTALCTHAGEVYTFGSGEFGQLGHRRYNDEAAPRVVDTLAGTTVTRVSAGYRHTMICTNTGQVHTFGDGDAGLLGHGEPGRQTRELAPRVVEALAGKWVVGVTAGGDHSAAWTADGEVYTWGHGAYGRLGHGTSQNEHAPRVVEILRGAAVIGVAAGQITAMWTDAGELFTCGDGEDGLLGHGSEENEYVPRLVEALEGVKVVDVSVQAHTVVCSGAGDIYTHGLGPDGRLGHAGETGPLLVPRLLQLSLQDSDRRTCMAVTS